MKLADVNMNDYAGFILPCMATPPDTPSPKEGIDIVEKAVEQGKPVAAQAAGMLYLWDSGVAEGKKIAKIGQGVIQDGSIITSGICPWLVRESDGEWKEGTPELTQKFIDTLKSLQKT
jgi:hypothetical protein